MIDRCQKFADTNSFQFGLEKSHVVVFGDDDDDPAEWSLHGQKMTQASSYRR